MLLQNPVALYVATKRGSFAHRSEVSAAKGGSYGNKILYKILKFSTRFSCENLAVEDFVTLFMGKKSC